MFEEVDGAGDDVTLESTSSGLAADESSSSGPCSVIHPSLGRLVAEGPWASESSSGVCSIGGQAINDRASIHHDGIPDSINCGSHVRICIYWGFQY